MFTVIFYPMMFLVISHQIFIVTDISIVALTFILYINTVHCLHCSTLQEIECQSEITFYCFKNFLDLSQYCVYLFHLSMFLDSCFGLRKVNHFINVFKLNITWIDSYIYVDPYFIKICCPSCCITALGRSQVGTSFLL